MSGKISQDTTVNYKSGIFIPGVDMSLGVGSQNVKLLASSFVNATFVTPQQFGATADGSHDDLPAINAAISAVSSAGGIVFFPPGVYAISGPVQIRSPDVTLQGSGAGNWLFGFQGNKGTTLLYTGG